MGDDTTGGSPSLRPTVADLARVFQEARSDRLMLRRPVADDSAAMFQIHGDPETNRYNPAGPDPDQATSEERLQEWLQQWWEDGYGYWVATAPPESDVVGFGGVRRITWGDREALNLYYRLAPAVWGQGYATELARVAVGLARVHLPHLPVIARTRASNRASMRTAERAGLLRRPDLDTDDHLVFALGWPLP